MIPFCLGVLCCTSVLHDNYTWDIFAGGDVSEICSAFSSSWYSEIFMDT